MLLPAHLTANGRAILAHLPIEQLRALWHGYRIRVLELADAPAAGVDTPQDLERVRALFAAGGV